MAFMWRRLPLHTLAALPTTYQSLCQVNVFRQDFRSLFYVRDAYSLKKFAWSCRRSPTSLVSDTIQSGQSPSSSILNNLKQFRYSHTDCPQTATEYLPSEVYIYNSDYMESGRKRYRVYFRGITKNLALYTQEPLHSAVDRNTLEIKKPTGNPLVLIMSWLMAKERHLKKYAGIYLELGFDVMVVHLTPWQLLWPTKGAQIVAGDVVKFLDSNSSYAPIVVHGFSVGAYLFGEVLLKIASNFDRYSHILNRTSCQIWDSAADITEIPIGLPKSVFPNNERMQNMLRNYTIYHLKTFHNQATIHYMRSSEMFHGTILKKPALLLVSENDLIGPPSSNNVLRANWERGNIKVTFQCWQDSTHIAHFMKHPDEYLALLYKHLEDSGVFSSMEVKKRAKL